jgi:hypothetical protein
MPSSSGTIVRRNVLRGVVIVVVATLIALWIRFAYELFNATQSRPAPAGIMLPVFFCMVALGAGLAALSGDGIKIALAGGISLVPIGFFLLFYPGSARLIPVLDVTLIALGVILMRSEGPAAADAEEPVPDGHPGDLA